MDGRPRDRTWRTGVQVSFSELGVPGEGEAFFDVEVPPRSTWRIQAYVVLLGDDLDAEHSDPDDELGRAEQEALHRVERWHRDDVREEDQRVAGDGREELSDRVAFVGRIEGDGRLVGPAEHDAWPVEWLLSLFLVQRQGRSCATGEPATMLLRPWALAA